MHGEARGESVGHYHQTHERGEKHVLLHSVTWVQGQAGLSADSQQLDINTQHEHVDPPNHPRSYQEQDTSDDFSQLIGLRNMSRTPKIEWTRGSWQWKS